MSPWIEKYRPKQFSDIKGQELALAKAKEFMESFNVGKLLRRRQKALILHGPPGTGKTTIAHVLANESNSEIFELNASDFRNKEKLEEILRPAIQQQSLMKKNKVILVDEADGISSVDDGAINELIYLIDMTTYPIIITANDVWGKNLAPLRQKAELVQLKEIDYKTIKDVLFDILRKENLFVNQNILTSISIRAKGDIRAAINDLQSVSRMKDPSILEFHEREKEVDIFNALKLIFKGKPTPKSLEVFDSVNMSIDEIILWVEENIPAEYSGKELERAYDLLSKVDVFRGRIYKQQYWRFLIYENALLSFGIASAKENLKTGFTSYKKPSRILKIWMNNQKNSKKKSISKKYAAHVHIGLKRAMNEFPILSQIIKADKGIQKELKLDEDELVYLNQ